MFYRFLLPLAHEYGGFNVFKYLSFRTVGAILTALFLSFILGESFIQCLKKKQGEGQPIRLDGPETHLLSKQGTPTMGGALILFCLGVSTVLWGDIFNPYVWIVMGVTFCYGLIGAYDDYLKLTKRSSHGLSGKMKLLTQFIIALLATWGIYELTSDQQHATSLAFPFFKDLWLNLGWFYFPFACCVIVGASNAVNLTDGLDGLSIVPVMIAAFCFALISYVVGNLIFSSYLQIHHVSNVGELAVFCGALIGAGLGFLWFNAPPAKVFMGDTGSLAVGGSLGVIAVITKHELVLGIVGGLFVLEAVSVILQVGYFKLTRKRIFLMAPIHHHFEKKGWAESTVVIRFWIIATILALIGLSTLKLR